MSMLDPELFRIEYEAIERGGATLRKACDVVRSLAAPGDSDDRFLAELECMSAWMARGQKGYAQATKCAMRLLQHVPADSYPASCAAARMLMMGRSFDLGLRLVKIGLDVSADDADICYRGWAASDLMANRLGLLAAIDPTAESTLEAVSDLSTLATSWHVEYSVVLNALDLIGSGGYLPWTAAGLLQRMWSSMAWSERGQDEKSEEMTRIEQLIAITEECPINLIGE